MTSIEYNASKTSTATDWKTYCMSGLFLFSFSVCMMETFCKAFSAKLCQLWSAFSNFSQSETDIISGWPIAEPSLETQDSINPSSDMICPWIPEIAWLDSVLTLYTIKPIKTLRNNWSNSVCVYVFVYVSGPQLNSDTHQGPDFAAVSSSFCLQISIWTTVKQKLKQCQMKVCTLFTCPKASKSVFSSFTFLKKLFKFLLLISPHHSLRWFVCPAVHGAQTGPCPALLRPAALREVHHPEKGVVWTAEGSYSPIFPGNGPVRPVSAGSKAASHLGSGHTGGPKSA